MAWDWFKKVINKVAAEVHRTKINEFEARILEIERKQDVILKCMMDNEKKLEKLDDRLYQANMESSAAVGAIKAIIQSGKGNQTLINQEIITDEHTNKK